MDPEQLKKVLQDEVERIDGRLVHKKSGRRVAAIMPVYTLGQPADMDAINEVAQQYQLPVVADAAAALGCRYKGKNIGSLADLTVFSFNGNKTITAGGGGMVVGDDENLLSLARHLSTTARIGSDYEHDRVGFNYRMTNLQAAVGCAQIERLDEFVSSKRRIDAQYQKAFKDLNGIDFYPKPSWAESACWFTGVLLNDDAQITVPEACEQLREKGVAARTFWKPVHLQTPFKKAPKTTMDVSEHIWEKILTLPCSTQLSEDEQYQVITAVKEII